MLGIVSGDVTYVWRRFQQKGMYVTCHSKQSRQGSLNIFPRRRSCECIHAGVPDGLVANLETATVDCRDFELLPKDFFSCAKIGTQKAAYHYARGMCTQNSTRVDEGIQR